MYISRFMDGLLAKAMKTSNSVLVTGPRQVGKSTMISHVLPKLRGQGAVVCNCSAPTHLRDNLLAMPVWYL